MKTTIAIVAIISAVASAMPILPVPYPLLPRTACADTTTTGLGAYSENAPSNATFTVATSPSPTPTVAAAELKNMPVPVVSVAETMAFTQDNVIQPRDKTLYSACMAMCKENKWMCSFCAEKNSTESL